MEKSTTLCFPFFLQYLVMTLLRSTHLHNLRDSCSDEYQDNEFWVVTPCSVVGVTAIPEGSAAFIFRVRHSSTQKMEAASSSYMLVPVYQVIRRHVPEIVY